MPQGKHKKKGGEAGRISGM